MIGALLALGCWFLYRRIWRDEPRRLRAAVVLLIGAWLAWGAVMEIIGYFVPDPWSLARGLVLVLPFSVLVLAGFLIRNGVQMVRREGRSLKNLLLLLAGAALVVLPVAAVLLVLTQLPLAIGAAALAFFVSAQIGLSFLTFLVFSVAYARRQPRTGADAVVVLGCGLVHGSITPLLASRLDRGLDAWEAQRRHRPEGRQQEALEGGAADPVAAWNLPMIPSGGRGADEPRAEADAMADYLVDHGIPRDLVRPEDRSRTTEENLRFSRTVADGSLPPGSAPGHLLVATNEYHAPRAALLSRRIGVDADVVGGSTAGYYVPSAYLREFAAVIVMTRRTQLVLALPGALLSLGLTVLLAAYRINSGG